MRIAVAGTGYVGLVTGVCLADKGHEVTCVDVDAKKVELLKRGVSPIYEEGLEALMHANRDRLRYTCDYESAYRDADVILIGVGTPEKKDGSADLRYVFEVSRQIAQSVKSDCIVAIKSTVPIGTNEKVESLIRGELTAPVRVDVASNPEVLAQGTAVRDTLYASRIVIGVETERAERILREMYRGFDKTKLVVTNRRSAEMIKYASNDFLALKISYINEIANLCEIVGADVTEVAEGMGYDARIGQHFLSAGIGYGGSCFPKDTKALHWLSNYMDYEMKTVKATIEVNEQQRIRLIKKARKYYPSLEGRTVAVLGLSFKPGTDDLREAPSLFIIPLLRDYGAHVRAWDPVSMERFDAIIGEDITYCASAREALTGADLCMILTEWPEVKALAPEVFLQEMASPLVLDGRNCYPLSQMRDTGVTYESIGRPIVRPEGPTSPMLP